MSAAIPDERESVGQRIRRRRQELGLAQSALAGEQVSASYISYVESGKRNPSVKALRDIAKCLGVSTEYLETGCDSADTDAELADAELELRLGDVSKAIELLGRVRSRASTAKDAKTAAQAEASLIVAHANDNDPATATTLFERLPANERPSISSRPDVYSAVARAYADQGKLV
ncbi:MAG: helix-turn-helix domain-containing protein, partial [Gaiellaceae bacterium]